MVVTKEKCYICGNTSDFFIGENHILFREAKCCNCGASIRNSDTAKVIVSKLIGKDIALTEAIEELKGYRILSTCSSGSIHNVLRESPNYIFGEYFDGVKSGEYKNNTLCIDLQDIPFYDDYFDLVISEDVFEHINDIQLAFEEINRVLKMNGQHIFTVPVHESKKTKERNILKNRVYHGDPIREGGAIVYTDFGNDIELIVDSFGMKTERFLLHKFYNTSDITDVDLEYEDYLKLRSDLLRFFKYNSIVFCSTKVTNLKHLNKRGAIMNFTGERYVPGKAFGEIETEHMQRYLALSDIIRGKKVLDAACGEGYGTYILSESARYVYGIDISEESIIYAKNRYKKDNIEYRQCSIEKLNFEDNSFDVVVSFETIEHVGEEIQELFLKEIKRVLKKDGILIISTPDRYVYSDEPKYKNEYHVKEFYFYEFRDFLNKYFKTISFYNQDIGMFGIIKSYDNNQNVCFKHINVQERGSEGKYIIATCSDGQMYNAGNMLSIYRHDEKSANDVSNCKNDIVQAFWDRGECFCEANSIREPYEIMNDFQKVDIELPENASGKLRVDIGNLVALVQIKNISIGLYHNRDVVTTCSNIKISEYCNMISISADDNSISLLSLNNDPQLILDYYLEPNGSSMRLSIELKVLTLTLSEGIAILSDKYNSSLAQIICKEDALIARNEDIRKQKEELELKDEDIRKQKEELELKDEDIRKQKEELMLQNAELINLKDSISKLQCATNELKNEILNIKGSLSWRITKPLRAVKNIVLKCYEHKS